MTDDLDRMVGDIAAISAEWNVDRETTSLLMGLQLLAIDDGCRTPDDGIRWSLERGYLEAGDRTWRITDAGEQAARQYLDR